MAPSQSNLMKAASEGFAMLDEYCRQKGRSKQPPAPQLQQQQYIHRFRHQPPKPHVQVIVPVPVPEVIKETVRIDCYEAAKVYGGTVIAEYPDTKMPPMRYMP